MARLRVKPDEQALRSRRSAEELNRRSIESAEEQSRLTRRTTKLLNLHTELRFIKLLQWATPVTMLGFVGAIHHFLEQRPPETNSEKPLRWLSLPRLEYSVSPPSPRSKSIWVNNRIEIDPKDPNPYCRGVLITLALMLVRIVPVFVVIQASWGSSRCTDD
jgi:hypothetical protein